MIRYLRDNRAGKEKIMIKTMRYSVILNNLFVGSCPINESDVKQLYDNNVTAILNLQTDEDFIFWEVNWEELEEAYKKFNLQLYRYPIRDFDVEDLKRKLNIGVELLGEMLKDNTVNLHCSAGINRSPTVAIKYLIKKRNLRIEEAVDYFRDRHYCEPYIEALNPDVI